MCTWNTSRVVKRTQVMMAAGIVGVWIRMKVIWVAVLARKKRECAWFKSCIFVPWMQVRFELWNSAEKTSCILGIFWPFCTSVCFEHLWFLEIAVITVLWYCTRMFHIVILWRSLQVGGNSWVWCRQRRPSLNKVFWHRMCLGVKGVKERCDKNTLWLAMRKNSEQGSSIFQDSQPNEDFQKRDSDTMEPQYLKRPWHHDCEKESKEDNTLAPDISNTQLQLIVSSLFELKYLLRYICCSHQGCLCSISLGCARHHERHRLDHPLDSRSESATKEVTKAVTIQWIWILFDVDLVTKAKPLCARAGVVLKFPTDVVFQPVYGVFVCLFCLEISRCIVLPDVDLWLLCLGGLQYLRCWCLWSGDLLCSLQNLPQRLGLCCSMLF